MRPKNIKAADKFKIMKAINLNSRPYYVTGRTVWDNGRVREFDDYKHEPMICPAVHRYGSEVAAEIKAGVNQFYKIPKECVGYTITYLTCEILNAAQHETENDRAEAHADEQLKQLDN